MRANKVADISKGISEQKQSGSGHVKDANESLERIEALLRQLQELIQKEGKEAINKAQEAQREFAKQSEEMRQMRDEAQSLALQHTDVAAGITVNADLAVNTSHNAFRMANEALTKQDETERELQSLRRSFDEFNDRFKDMQNEALEINKKNKKCRDDAESIHKSLKKGIPTSEEELERYREKAASVSKTATNIQKAAEGLKKQYKEVIEKVYESITKAQKLFDDTYTLQQILDDLLGKVDVAFQKAKDAKAQAEAILKEANETLTILKNFDNEVSNSKSKAEDALNQIAKIEALIKEAELKTRDANEALVGAGKDSETSLADSKQALKIVNRLRDQTMDSLNEVQKTSLTAQQVRDRTDTLHSKVQGKDRSLLQLETKADSDLEKAADAEKIAITTKESSQQSKLKATKLLVDLELILYDLANLSAVNPLEVLRLKDDLDEGERRLGKIDLDVEMARLDIGARQQEEWFADYSRQLTDLEKDVINVEEIRASLPGKCYNYIPIEEGGLHG